MTQNILAIHILLSLIQLIHFLSLFVFHFHSSFFSSFLLQESSPTITLVSSKVSSAYAFHLHNNLFIACFSSSFHLRTPYSLRLHESSEINKKAWILRKIELNRKKRISHFFLHLDVGPSRVNRIIATNRFGRKTEVKNRKCKGRKGEMREEGFLLLPLPRANDVRSINIQLKCL